MIVLIFHMTAQLKCRVTFWVVSLILNHHPARFVLHKPYETGNNVVCSISSNSNSNAEVYKWPDTHVITIFMLQLFNNNREPWQNMLNDKTIPSMQNLGY